MPTYEYTCDACGHNYELVQRITEEAIKKCPRCGKPKAHRLVGSGNFILKGGGWESDLYSGKSNRAPEKASKSETKEKSSASTPATKSESSSTPSTSDKPAKKPKKKESP